MQYRTSLSCRIFVKYIFKTQFYMIDFDHDLKTIVKRVTKIKQPYKPQASEKKFKSTHF